MSSSPIHRIRLKSRIYWKPPCLPPTSQKRRNPNPCPSISQKSGMCIKSAEPNPGLAPLILRSEEHTSELQSRFDLVCRLLLEKKNTSQKLEIIIGQLSHS